MTRDEFWDIIDRGRSTSEEAVGWSLRVLLLGRPVEELFSFDRHFCELHAAAYDRYLWAAAFIGWGGCSDDMFYDFRTTLIMRGRCIYELAVRLPGSLADVYDPVEGLLGIDIGDTYCSRLYRERTGRDDYVAQFESRYPEPVRSPELGPRLDYDDDDEVRRRLPGFAEQYIIDAAGALRYPPPSRLIPVWRSHPVDVIGAES